MNETQTVEQTVETMETVAPRPNWVTFHPSFKGQFVSAGRIALACQNADPGTRAEILKILDEAVVNIAASYEVKIPLVTELYCIGASYQRQYRSYYARFDIYAIREEVICDKVIRTNKGQAVFLPVTYDGTDWYFDLRAFTSAKRVVLSRLIAYLGDIIRAMAVMDDVDDLLGDSGL